MVLVLVALGGLRSSRLDQSQTVGFNGAQEAVLPQTCLQRPHQSRSSPALPPPAFEPDEIVRAYASTTSSQGRWVDLTTLEWEVASSGWRPLADDNAPRRGQAFTGGPLTVGGRIFSSGIGTYPFSEVVYALSGAYSALQGRVGLDDSAPAQGSARFSVYADDILLFRSPTLLSGGEAIPVQIPLFGAERLRLVVDSADGDVTGDYADWLGLELFQPAGAITRGRDQLTDIRPPTSSTSRTLSALPPASAPELSGDATGLRFDAGRCLIVLGNRRLQAAFGYGGPHHGRLSLLPTEGVYPALIGASAEIRFVAGDKLSLADTQPVAEGGWQSTLLSDPALGAGRQVQLHLQSPSGDRLAVEIALYDAGYLTYQIRPGGSLTATGYELLSGAQLLLGSDPHFIADRGRTWHGALAADALERVVPLEPGKPFLGWSKGLGHGLLMATIDESDAPMELRLIREPGVLGANVSLAMRFLPIELQQPGVRVSPRLWIAPVNAGHVFDAFSAYRDTMSRLYPPAPIPPWALLQWNSWWVYGPTPTEERINRQTDYIQANLSDLGPWSILIDAGWHVAYGRPTADLRNVDYEKFPNGLKAVSDYAHERGLKIALYLSAGFVLQGEDPGGEWLAMQAVIDEHPDWLIPVHESPRRKAYMLNYAHPGVQEYMKAVVTDFVEVHGVDGIQLDGLADPEGQFTDRRARDLRGDFPLYFPATDVYRLIANQLYRLRPDAYLEGGWINPVFAHPYAHSFWWADESPSFDEPYPFPGLHQHIDYALFQKMALGQRAKLAHALGDPNSRQARRWFEAALALGVQVGASLDFTKLQPAGLSALRSLLAHYKPFEGQTVTSAEEMPAAFATTHGHLSYLGVLNRSSRSMTFAAEIRSLGVLAPGLMAYDVEGASWLPAASVSDLMFAPKSFRLFLVPSQPRIVWSNASWSYEPSGDDRLVATLRGPTTISGFAEIWAPETKAVLLDGVPLSRGAAPAPGQYAYDLQGGVVRIQFVYGEPRRLEVRW